MRIRERERATIGVFGRGSNRLIAPVVANPMRPTQPTQPNGVRMQLLTPREHWRAATNPSERAAIIIRCLISKERGEQRNETNAEDVDERERDRSR